jgi:ectoine hydroxylase-related dioxygenase (phytanoyl-CoA dioxygenase family)
MPAEKRSGQFSLAISKGIVKIRTADRTAILCQCPLIRAALRRSSFFDNGVLSIVHSVMDDRVVADQWGCDVPLSGSQRQEAHVDYQRPLFAEAPDLPLPPYLLIVSFGLNRITLADGPIEIAPGTHRMTKQKAVRAVQSTEIEMQSVPLQVGDVLIRHPWALHRGTPNTTGTPRVLVTIRYVRRWYADNSREINPIPQAVWESLTSAQQGMLRFPVSW